jgi:hypothetical protein
LVFGHSSDGESFAAERVGQQALEGFHLSPLVFLCCLDDTRLEPTHIAVDCMPINVMPSFDNLEGRTSRKVCCHLLVSFVGLLGFLAMKDQMEVCPLSREAMLLALSL